MNKQFKILVAKTFAFFILLNIYSFLYLNLNAEIIFTLIRKHSKTDNV